MAYIVNRLKEKEAKKRKDATVWGVSFCRGVNASGRLRQPSANKGIYPVTTQKPILQDWLLCCKDVFPQSSTSRSSTGTLRRNASLKEMRVSVRASPRGCNFSWMMLSMCRLFLA